MITLEMGQGIQFGQLVGILIRRLQMEIKGKLNKPYTEEQRIEFVFQYQYGYEIRESAEALEAWGYTEEEKEQRERERISRLKCTKRVLALMLQELGIAYTTLKELIASNEQAQLEWELCVELERSNPLIDAIGLQLGISSKQIDALFRYANGEIDKLEVING